MTEHLINLITQIQMVAAVITTTEPGAGPLDHPQRATFNTLRTARASENHRGRLAVVLQGHDGEAAVVLRQDARDLQRGACG
jgi:hypothetical protein